MQPFPLIDILTGDETDPLGAGLMYGGLVAGATCERASGAATLQHGALVAPASHG